MLLIEDSLGKLHLDGKNLANETMPDIPCAVMALEPVFAEVFYAHPLGNITPTPEQRTLLVSSAMDILNQV